MERSTRHSRFAPRREQRADAHAQTVRRASARRSPVREEAARRAEREPAGRVVRDRQFMPSRSATIPAGKEATLRFRGDNGAAFGIDHMSFGGGYEGLLASARTEAGERGIFRRVHVTALRDLFLRRRLKGLIEIKRRNDFALTLHNPTDEERTVVAQLSGYSGPDSMEAQKECLAAEHGAGASPAPKLTVASDTVPAGSTAFGIPVPGRAYDMTFQRFFVGSDVSLDSLRVALKLFGGDTVLAEVYASQLQDTFRSLEATRPWLVEQETPMRLEVTNEAAEDALVSVVFEAYRQ